MSILGLFMDLDYLLPQNLTHVFLECRPPEEQCPDVRLNLGSLRLQTLEGAVVDDVLFPLSAAVVSVRVVQPDDQPAVIIK